MRAPASIARLLPALGLVLASWPGLARAEVRLCVKVETDRKADQDGLEKLVKDELGHHPSHEPVGKGCDSTLVVQLFTVSSQTYLTVRLEGQVPVRYRLKDMDLLEKRLGQAISLVLENDPVYLSKDMSRATMIEKAKHDILVTGHNYYGLEAFQVVGNTNNAFGTASGLAFAFNRGSKAWHVLMRTFVAGWPGYGGNNEAAIKAYTGVDLAAGYELDQESMNSLYLDAGVSLAYMRLEARLVDPGSGKTSWESTDQFLGSVLVRAGYKMLRLFDFNADAYLALRIPLHPLRDVDSTLFKGWFYTPMVELGVGIGF
ncbi:MAG: hypothetical protein GXP49_08625 [Deltaproteobacteria bacterium]|nr:hypothetical protein [Deltaproteobacteria bacterium]